MNVPRVTQTRGAFAIACGVEVNIRTGADRIWSLLTDAKNFPRWNSTVTGIEGQIREGERLRLHAPGTDRTFTPRVSGVVRNERMTWARGVAPLFKGMRTFELRPQSDGTTDFVMKERFAGLMLPLVKGSLPDFGPVFERYANDLKHEAERQKWEVSTVPSEAPALKGLGNLVERTTPWLLDVGSWIFGGLSAFSLVVIASLITVGPVDRAILISITALAATLT